MLISRPPLAENKCPRLLSHGKASHVPSQASASFPGERPRANPGQAGESAQGTLRGSGLLRLSLLLGPVRRSGPVLHAAGG